MRFTINLATRTYIDHRRVNFAFTAVLALLLALLTWNVVRFSWNLGELRRIKSETAALEGRLSSRPSGVPEAEYKRLLASIRFYNDVIQRKTVNWLGLLEQVEQATPDGVALSAFSPDPKTGDLKIEGRAKSFTQVRTYLDALENAKTFSNILLLSHRDIATGEKGRGVQFAITCRTVLQ